MFVVFSLRKPLVSLKRQVATQTVRYAHSSKLRLRVSSLVNDQRYYNFSAKCKLQINAAWPHRRPQVSSHNNVHKIKRPGQAMAECNEVNIHNIKNNPQDSLCTWKIQKIWEETEFTKSLASGFNLRLIKEVVDNHKFSSVIPIKLKKS